jgi:hypothetical protein
MLFPFYPNFECVSALPGFSDDAGDIAVSAPVRSCSCEGLFDTRNKHHQQAASDSASGYVADDGAEVSAALAQSRDKTL